MVRRWCDGRNPPLVMTGAPDELRDRAVDLSARQASDEPRRRGGPRPEHLTKARAAVSTLRQSRLPLSHRSRSVGAEGVIELGATPMAVLAAAIA